MPAAVATEVDSHLDTAFADAVVLREKTGAAQRLELAGLADLGGDADTAQIDAGALRAADEFEVSAEGRLGIADAAHPVVPLWAGSVEVPADGAVVSLPLSADLRPFGVIRGSAIASVSPYAAVRVAMIVPGAVVGTAASRPTDARTFAAVFNSDKSTRVYYWRSAGGQTLYLQNDTSAATPLPVGLLSLVGVRNSGVGVPSAMTAVALELVVSPASLTVNEGGTSIFSVRLASQPAADVRITASETDADISVSPTHRDFTTSDWNTEQEFTVRGLQDTGTANDTATVSLASSGGGYDAVTALVNVVIVDDDKLVLPVIRHIDETIYRLSQDAPSAPASESPVGDVPQGWLSDQPSATATESVWEATRTVTTKDDVFSSATVWTVNPVPVEPATPNASVTVDLGTDFGESEHEEITLSPSVSGNYDEIDYSWSGGGLNGRTTSSVTFRGPSVRGRPVRLTYTVTVTVRGTGTLAYDGTSATQSDSVTVTWMDEG